MASPIKRQNHRIHPCTSSQKIDLIRFLIARYAGKSVLVITSDGVSEVADGLDTSGAEVFSDSGLKEGTQFDVVISYDLPEDVAVYLSRLTHSREFAFVVMDAEDEKRLYPIELQLGRTIVREIVKGFEPESETEAMSGRRERSASKKREGEKQPRPPRKEGAKKEENAQKRSSYGSKPKFTGKDESGKAMFEGKTRDRNHYIDGTPRTEEEKATRSRYQNKPKFYGEKGEVKENSAKKSGNKQKSYDGKKSFGDPKESGEKRGYSDQKENGGKKPYGGKKPQGDKKSYAKSEPKKPEASVKRTGKRIDVKSLKPKEPEQ